MTVPRPHEHVPHPREFLKRESGAARRLNRAAAFKVAAFYGSAAAIWIFAVYSMLGAVVSNGTQNHMLYWSNGVQLVFCAVMTFVGNQLGKSQNAKADADHQALTSIHNTVDEIRAALAKIAAGKDGTR
jgi:hypothetical protein